MSAQMGSALTKVRAAIIDLDGTMLDTMGDFLVAINAMRADLTLLPLTKSRIQNMVGKGSEHLIRQVLAVDFSEVDVELQLDAAMQSYQRHYLSINGLHSTLYPEVHEGLRAMQAQGIRLACVTNKPLNFAIPLLQQKSLHRYFEVIYGGDSFAHKKPHPEAMLQVASDFALAPDRIVAIGDSSNDALAARAAGCWSLVVPYGYNHGQAVHQIDSDGIVETLLCAARLLHS